MDYLQLLGPVILLGVTLRSEMSTITVGSMFAWQLKGSDANAPLAGVNLNLLHSKDALVQYTAQKESCCAAIGRAWEKTFRDTIMLLVLLCEVEIDTILTIGSIGWDFSMGGAGSKLCVYLEEKKLSKERYSINVVVLVEAEWVADEADKPSHFLRRHRIAMIHAHEQLC